MSRTMADTASDEGFLLAVLNSTPVIDGVRADDFADSARARAWLAAAGGAGTDAELRHVLEVLQMLQAVVRGQQSPAASMEHRCCPNDNDGTSMSLGQAHGSRSNAESGPRCAHCDRSDG